MTRTAGVDILAGRARQLVTTRGMSDLADPAYLGRNPSRTVSMLAGPSCLTCGGSGLLIVLIPTATALYRRR
jgi:hypothetical protein